MQLFGNNKYSVTIKLGEIAPVQILELQRKINDEAEEISPPWRVETIITKSGEEKPKERDINLRE